MSVPPAHALRARAGLHVVYWLKQAVWALFWGWLWFYTTWCYMGHCGGYMGHYRAILPPAERLKKKNAWRLFDSCSRCYHAPAVKPARHVDYCPEYVLKYDATAKNVCRLKYFLQANDLRKPRQYFLNVLQAETKTACKTFTAPFYRLRKWTRRRAKEKPRHKKTRDAITDIFGLPAESTPAVTSSKRLFLPTARELLRRETLTKKENATEWKPAKQK